MDRKVGKNLKTISGYLPTVPLPNPACWDWEQAPLRNYRLSRDEERPAVSSWAPLVNLLVCLLELAGRGWETKPHGDCSAKVESQCLRENSNVSAMLSRMVRCRRPFVANATETRKPKSYVVDNTDMS